MSQRRPRVLMPHHAHAPALGAGLVRAELRQKASVIECRRRFLLFDLSALPVPSAGERIRQFPVRLSPPWRGRVFMPCPRQVKHEHGSARHINAAALEPSYASRSASCWSASVPGARCWLITTPTVKARKPLPNVSGAGAEPAVKRSV